jgi:hypothetical protein
LSRSAERQTVGVHHEVLEARCHSDTVTMNLGHTENEALVNSTYDYEKISLSFFLVTEISILILFISYFRSQISSDMTMDHPNATLHRRALTVLLNDTDIVQYNFAVLIPGHMPANLCAEPR